MKNTFKLFGMLLLASATMFVACDPTEEGNGKTQYTITVQANDATMGTVTGGGVVDSGAAITLTATPNAEYNFVNWSMPDGTTSTNNPLVVVATGNATYTANFTEQSGVKVTFGSTTWDAQYINGVFSASQNAFVIAATQNASPDSYPQVELGYTWEGTPGPVTAEGSPSITGTQASKGNPYLWYYTDAEHAMRLGSDACGDYWNITMTLNITAFDATTATISLIANATMGNLYELTEGGTWPNVTTQSATVKVTNQRLTAAKGNIFTKGAGMIAAR